jgi:predicted phage tail protein
LDENLAGQLFLEERFRDEFKPAFGAWLEQVPEGEVPPGTPFSMDAYQMAAEAEAERLNAAAESFANTSANANQTGDNFVLAAVVMASVLFFAGVGTKLKARAVRLFMLLIGTLFFIGGVAFMLSMPQNVGI